MAEAVAYSFSLKELTELLVREQGITEGTWVVGFNLNFGAGLMVIGPNEAPKPSSFMQINHAVLERAPQPLPPHAVDAAKLAPKR